MLHSSSGLRDKNSVQTGKENSRKLERMRMVRGVADQRTAMKMGNSSQVKRRKDFQVLDLYRKDNKFHKIDSHLTDSICSEIAFDAASGVAYYFEHELKNPFNETLVVMVEIPDPSVSLVCRANELRYFKNLYNSLTPIEDNLIHFGDQDEPQIFLQPKESVYVPFKYQSYQIRPPSQNSKHFDEFKITIKFLTLDNKPVSVLIFKVKPQPTLTDFTMHFYHPEKIFFKKTFLLPSTLFPHPSDYISDEISIISSDKNVFAVVSRSEVGDSFQLHLKVACDNQVYQQTFCLLLYNNRFLSRPAQTWEICIHSLSRIDMNCTFGQSSYAKVYLKGTAFTRVVQAFSSHPHVLQIQPKENFVLSANSMMEINLGVRPTFTGNRNMCVNVVDREMSQIVQQWMVCITSQEPNISRSFQIIIPTHQSRVTTKKIAFRNPYAKKKEFSLHSSRPDVLSFKENSFQANGLTPHTIFLNFQPVSFSLDIDILIFINDSHDNTEECFCVQVSYQNV